MLFQGGECSFKPNCDEEESVSSSVLKKALEDWAYPGAIVPCRYNPATPTLVILTSDYKRKLITLIFTLVTSLICISCIFVMVITASTCGCRYIWSKHAPLDLQEKVLLWKRGKRSDNG